MKKNPTILFGLIIYFIFANIYFSQTTLSPGDVMFIGINADANSQNGSPDDEEFLFLLLVDVTTGTEIYFTDMGYTGNSAPFFQQNVNNGCGAGTGAVSDGLIKWEATSAVSKGTQILLRVKNTLTTNVGSVTSIVETATVGRAMDLSTSGETIHALQGTLNGSNQFTSVTMISSMRIRTSWDATVSTCEFNSLNSEDPGTGFEFEWNSSNPNDNGYYSGSTSGDKATLQAAILNPSNWTFHNTTVYDLPISGSFPVPVELTSFTALLNNDTVELRWETATEVNNYGFEVERAIKNEELEINNWEKIGFVLGHGNSNSPKSYEFIDASPFGENRPSGNLQYRLKQIDTDGTYEYYNLTAEVDATITSLNDEQLPEEFHLSQNYPNPFNPSTTITYTIPVVDVPSGVEVQHVSLKVYDILGNEVSQLVNKSQAAGIYQVEFDANKLTSGMYFYKLETGSFTETKKMMLIK